MTAEEELIVREWLTIRVAAAVVFDRVIPAPIYFTDKADYLAVQHGATAPETQVEIDEAHIAFACIYLKGPADDPTTPPHSPTTTWTYECYMFSERDYTRQVEGLLVPPDTFAKRMLLRHNEFVASVIGVKSAFQGEINIPGLTGYVTSQTLPTTVREEIQNDTTCEFVGGLRGSSVRLGLQARMEAREC